MLVVNDLLSRDELRTIREHVACAAFQDGRLTAGPAARRVKINEQADPSSAETRQALAVVRAALCRSAVLSAYAQPSAWSGLLLSRYGVGDSYGLHNDDPVTQDDNERPMRTDLSFTVFLSEPDTYAGGELVFRDRLGERSAKPHAGSVVLYPTGVLHRVARVQSGERLAAVGWIQSRIRSGEHREILFDVNRLRASVSSENRLLADQVLGRLTRLWLE